MYNSVVAKLLYLSCALVKYLPRYLKAILGVDGVSSIKHEGLCVELRSDDHYQLLRACTGRIMFRGSGNENRFHDLHHTANSVRTDPGPDGKWWWSRRTELHWHASNLYYDRFILTQVCRGIVSFVV